MNESVAHAAPGEEHEEHAHGGVHDPNVHHSPEEIRAELKIYWLVFGGLALLTGITVGLRYLNVPLHYAIGLALAVAVIKGSLVAGFFMHLLSEKKLIYAILGLTVFFFAVLLWGPWNHVYDLMK